MVSLKMKDWAPVKSCDKGSLLRQRFQTAVGWWWGGWGWWLKKKLARQIAAAVEKQQNS